MGRRRSVSPNILKDMVNLPQPHHRIFDIKPPFTSDSRMKPPSSPPSYCTKDDGAWWCAASSKTRRAACITTGTRLMSCARITDANKVGRKIHLDITRIQRHRELCRPLRRSGGSHVRLLLDAGLMISGRLSKAAMLKTCLDGLIRFNTRGSPKYRV